MQSFDLMFDVSLRVVPARSTLLQMVSEGLEVDDSREWPTIAAQLSGPLRR